ncbi:MAG: hypothetical protein OXI94_01090 [Gemmatimonadota bacterium]|nr:hypothetical protein [Gemmatimonadota bacterium]
MPDQLYLSPLMRTKYRQIILVLLFTLLPSSAHTAFEFQPIGAHTSATGDAGVALATGAAGAFWNPAALAWGKRISLFGTYDRPFGIAELATQAFSAGLRTGRHGLGVKYTGFGFALYKEQVLGLIYGLRVFQQLSLGFGIRALQLSTAGMPTQHWVVFDAGIKLQIREGVFLGAAIWNAGGSHTSLLGQSGTVGMGIAIMPQVALVADIQKEATFPTGAGIGIIYHIHPQLVLRTGAGGQPERLSAGFGLRTGGFAIDYAAVWHTILGITHRASVIYEH